MQEAHRTSFAARRRFKSEDELNNWILSYYAERLAYYSKNIGKRTVHDVLITPKILKITRERYLTLLMRKYNVTNGQLPTINK